MSQTPPDDGTLDIVTSTPEPQDTPPADEKPKRRGARSTTAADDDADAKRYAVYDLTFLRFVGPVRSSKSDATAALKAAAKADDRDPSTFEVRDV